MGGRGAYSSNNKISNKGKTKKVVTKLTNNGVTREITSTYITSKGKNQT